MSETAVVDDVRNPPLESHMPHIAVSFARRHPPEVFMERSMNTFSLQEQKPNHNVRLTGLAAEGERECRCRRCSVAEALGLW
jgi:hypothetical protein